MEQPVLITVAWLALAIALVLSILLLRQRNVTRYLRSRNAQLARAVRIRDEELVYFVTTRLPELIESIPGRAVSARGGLHAELYTVDFGGRLDSILATFTETMDKAVDRANRSATTTLKSIMRRVQSLATEQQLDISAMEDRHDHPDVLEDLLKIDHTNAQLIRRAEVIAVLCGSWPGQQRSASTLVDVVRGATSRIRDYRRVELNGELEVAVVSQAVEPVVLAVAELLDNAARHSHPNSSVEVHFQPSHHGTAIVIDDAGVGMNADEAKYALNLLSTSEGSDNGRHPVDIGQLGDPPRTGFAVIGILAARYGFTVSADMRSPYGGTRTIVFLPNALLTRVSDKAAADTGTAAEPPHRGVEKAADEASEQRQTTSSGLPKRRRRPPAPERRPDNAGTVTEAPARPARQSSATGLGAWQRGTQSGRTTEGA